jgi:hypothetical protein
MNGDRRKTFSSGSIPKNVENRRRRDTFDRSGVRSALEYWMMLFWYESSVLLFDELLLDLWMGCGNFFMAFSAKYEGGEKS